MGIFLFCLVVLAAAGFLVTTLFRDVRSDTADGGVPNIDVFYDGDGGGYDGGSDGGCDGGDGGCE